jgi:microsomal dipeptidase-like Zn-dependent dipeptidase
MDENELILKLKPKLKENISILKKLGPPGREGDWCPFFISLDHHFWNQLGGHAVSLWEVIRKVLDQRPGINSGITDLGIFVMNELLDNSGGQRRILIDTAHMSIKVRQWYYQYLTDRGDHIPVFVSHTGVNGKANMAMAEMHGTPDTIHNEADRLYVLSDQFNPWDVFVSDEEIMIIHNSGGIMGLNLDQRIGMGKKKLDETKKQASFSTVKKAREIWVKPFVDEILHIARYICEQTGQKDTIWDNISIGSDFNGMITPLQPFRNAEKFPALQKYIFRELKKRSAAEVVLSGCTDSDIQEITDKIMWKNNLRFLEKHFHR